MQTVDLVDFSLELETQAHFLTECLLSRVVLLDKDCLLIVQIHVIFSQFFNLPENLSVFLLVKLFVSLYYMLLPHDFWSQHCNFGWSFSLDFTNNCHHAALWAIFQYYRINSPNSLKHFDVSVCQFLDQTVKAHPKDKQAAIKASDILRGKALSNKGILVYSQFLESAIGYRLVEILIMAIFDKYRIEPFLNTPLLDLSSTPLPLVSLQLGHLFLRRKNFLLWTRLLKLFRRFD